MKSSVFLPDDGVTLLGGGPFAADHLAKAINITSRLVCADGGYNAARAAGLTPEVVIGDLDSLEDPDTARETLGERLLHVEEQDSTDLEKCLSRIEAPFIVGVGLLGGRMDHSLAALHAIIADPRPIILIGEEDIVFAAPLELAIRLEAGDRLSIFPLLPVSGRGGDALKWPIEGLNFEAGSLIGTSNEVVRPDVSLGFNKRGTVICTPPERLVGVLDALLSDPSAGHNSGEDRPERV
ncbi:MAG: thiamine diphosphokinase [Pseudomonadota bacterium]